ncbi:AraC family transcriptional regulator [Lacticaseibacillus baoqingensis]|uniref:AraC family transcriptional regulator n=1 Tax=Lacticaseibacillus baoqingensis TaxID=2486013 RepID=A0ABW4E819_9LACO|nr:AraC family transcriptional regulator [Lacticaseibacillus baoqingensis]
MPKTLHDKLFALNDVEQQQLESGNNFNYMDLDFIDNPIPQMPAWNFFKDGEIAVTKNNRFSYVPAHTHSFIELNYVYAGSCTQYINDEKIVLHSGELLLMDKEIVQRIDYTGRDDVLVNILIKSDPKVSDLLQLIPDSINIVSQLIDNVANDHTLHNNFILFDLNQNVIAKNLIASLIQKGLTTPLPPQRNQSLALILSALIIELRTTVEKSVINFTDTARASLVPIIRYINENYLTATLGNTAKQFDYNRNYLSNKLKTATGKSFQELIDRRRLSVAENLMIKTDLTNEEICDLVGYRNSASLYRLFQKYLNSTPAAYRRKVHPRFDHLGQRLPTQEEVNNGGATDTSQ